MIYDGCFLYMMVTWKLSYIVTRFEAAPLRRIVWNSSVLVISQARGVAKGPGGSNIIDCRGVRESC